MTLSEDKERQDAAYHIYIMRHGIATKRGSEIDDSKRTLTAEGREKMQKTTRGLKRLGFAVDWIVTSPLARALETAQIVAASFGPTVPLDLCEYLSPGQSSEKLLAFLAKQPERRRVLLVGHEPDLSSLAARLFGAGPDAELVFKKGGCCLITSDDLPPKLQGRLVWWATPRILRAIA